MTQDVSHEHADAGASAPAQAAERADAQADGAEADSASGSSSIHRIAAFDFDGTSIQGNSPVMLVRHLKRLDMLDKRVLAKIVSWGAAYKLHLPQSEAWVRGLVFTAFQGWRKSDADAFLADFYDEAIEARHRFRPQAEAAMRSYRSRGFDVVVVSATFAPIVRRAQQFHPFDACLSTEMAVDDQGFYTCEVDGECIEGEAKVRAITAWADARYGAGNWELSAAFGDHHSDIPLLEAAVSPFAVSPNSTLSRVARERGWTTLHWDVDVEK